jgi:glycosyltransferase involved in cell wall biosynthesis
VVLEVAMANGKSPLRVGHVGAFAEKINLLADSPQLRHEMGEYNRSKVEKLFILDRMVNEYRELFEEVLS